MKVLLPIDGSNSSLDTLAWAIENFNKDATHYYLLYVVVEDLSSCAIREHWVQEATAVLNEAIEKLNAHGCHIHKAEYRFGEPVDEICSYAESSDIDQILIGTHGRTKLAKLLMGSVSSKVLEICKKPVLVYRNIQLVKENFSAAASKKEQS